MSAIRKRSTLTVCRQTVQAPISQTRRFRKLGTAGHVRIVDEISHFVHWQEPQFPSCSQAPAKSSHQRSDHRRKRCPGADNQTLKLRRGSVRRRGLPCFNRSVPRIAAGLKERSWRLQKYSSTSSRCSPGYPVPLGSAVRVAGSSGHAGTIFGDQLFTNAPKRSSAVARR